MERALANPPPRRDLVDIARRFKSVTSPPVATATEEPIAVGQYETFWVADGANKRYFQTRAQLVRRTEHVDFYVQEGERVAEDGIDRSLRRFEETIVPTVIRYFGGSAIALDRLRFTILNARIAGIVGYYSSVDEYPSAIAPFSNERPLIAMSLRSVQPGSRGYDSGLAHEFQHLVQWRLDPAEDTWVNEGTAELAIRAVGLQGSGNQHAFAQRPNTQLNHWAESLSETPAHYGAAFMFFSYLADRFGGYEIIGEILAQQRRGAIAIDQVLGRRASGDQPKSFDAAFLDWSLANWVNDAAATDGRYGYVENQSFRVQTAAIEVVPTRLAGDVHQYASRFYELPPDVAGKAMRLSGDTSVRLVDAPERPNSFWWSNRSDSADSRLTRAVDLSGVTSASLTFETWYDLEADFDYAFVAVSEDSGTSWVTLPGQRTTTTNPNGANLGAGFTGSSGGDASWVRETVDLSGYAGKEILLRFEMITDDAYNGAGFCIDRIAIPEIGWEDREGDAGWQAEGFTRIRNRVPQRLTAVVVAVGDNGVQTYAVALGGDASSAIALPSSLSSARRVGLVVSAHTPLTILPAEFTIDLSTP